MQNLSRVADASLAAMLQRAREQRHIRHTLVVLARLRPILEPTGKMKASLREDILPRSLSDTVAACWPTATCINSSLAY
ncbi:hypothetical protein PC116_g670 [Phytophthora cactorum]|uniref:Uncharacterized protein n=1 Tax=Phytophthora cactorum TaxID=29920 RepID=A0A8T1E8R4_9STRA|nr:hypothetical protein PC114_g497 [Phytophthora cactorum]KAG2950893.1 hypothetical protein PC117_g4082 [Phytophthora cactorum]KAG3042421.1 hypothetical protein PC119_g148 [Phytophthora cactorum]KAG3189738.1 hypothetical protein C6341_g2079 [Phytophthora cactorum]KAG3207277.1 hypothetical protein PC128_g194 [Phytophthora cactorum]